MKLAVAVVSQILLGLVRLTTYTVLPCVRLLIDIAGRLTALPHLLCSSLVVSTCGADKVIWRQIKYFLKALNLCSVVVYILLHFLPLLLCCFKNLLPVLVSTGREEDLFARKTPRTREHVRLDYFKRKTDMRVGIYVRKRGGDVARHRLRDEFACLTL